MKVLCWLLVVVLIAMQYQLWFGSSGYFQGKRLAQEMQVQQERAALLTQGNRLLTAEVVALKGGAAALESRAREDLGLVKADEVFYLVLEPSTDQ